jgi:hypothetical protein
MKPGCAIKQRIPDSFSILQFPFPKTNLLPNTGIFPAMEYPNN